jgi:hypothetical protein
VGARKDHDRGCRWSCSSVAELAQRQDIGPRSHEPIGLAGSAPVTKGCSNLGHHRRFAALDPIVQAHIQGATVADNFQPRSRSRRRPSVSRPGPPGPAAAPPLRPFVRPLVRPPAGQCLSLRTGDGIVMSTADGVVISPAAKFGRGPSRFHVKPRSLCGSAPADNCRTGCPPPIKVRRPRQSTGPAPCGRARGWLGVNDFRRQRRSRPTPRPRRPRDLATPPTGRPADRPTADRRLPLHLSVWKGPPSRGRPRQAGPAVPGLRADPACWLSARCADI